MSHKLSYVKSESGLEVVILNNGDAYCTQSSYARFSGLSQQAISKRAADLDCVDVADLPSTTLVVDGKIIKNVKLDVGGATTPTVTLIPAKIFGLWIVRDNPELAEAILEAGAKAFLYSVAGYEIKAEVESSKELPKTYLAALKELVASEEERIRLETENKELMQEVEDLTEVVDELFDYSSIIRIAKFNGCSEKLFNWRTLTLASTKLGLEIKKAPCPRYGTKNLYSHDAWRIAYPDIKLPESLTIMKVSD